MVAILRVPGVMFQQREVPVRTVQTEEVQACLVETESATINTCQPALEDQEQPPSVISGAISGAGSGLGAGCTGFTVGDPPVDDVPDAEGGDDAVEPEDGTELVDVDGDGEPDDVPPPDDGETPEVHDDGEIFDFEDGEVEEDGETTGPCDNSPTISSTTSPVDGAPNIPLTPTLDWDAGDLDAGDTLTYRVRLWRTDDPSTALVDETVSDSQYAIPAGILANNVNYSWQIDAWDTCAPTANLISSPVWAFTTEPACAPYSFTDPTDLSLPEDPSAWTYRYEGDVLPDAAGWTRHGAFVTTPASDGDIFSMSTLGSNLAGYYDRVTSFNHATGSVIQARVVVDEVDGVVTRPADAGFVLSFTDGVRAADIMVYPDQVCEAHTTCSAVDPAVFNTFTVEFGGFGGDDFRLYVNGELAIDGTGAFLTAGSGTPGVAIGDLSGAPDSSSRVDYYYYNTAGDRIRYLSPTPIESAPQDTGVAANGHEGAIINWSPASAPGTVSIAVRAADDLTALASAPWSAEMTDNPATIPAGVIGRYLQWRITLTAPAAPTTPPVIDEVSASQTCP